MTSSLMSARRTTRHAAITALDRAGMLARARARVARQGVVVLTFHRIVPDADLAACWSPEGMVLRESLFARLIHYLRDTTCSLSAQALEMPSVAASRPTVLLTFDDGWVDNALVAWPYLRRAGLDALIFLTTGLLGRSRPFWPERFLQLLHTAKVNRQTYVIQRSLAELQRSACTPGGRPRPPEIHRSATHEVLRWLKQFPSGVLLAWLDGLETIISGGRAGCSDPLERLLDRSELRQLAAEGACFGSHTVSHAILPQLAPAELWRELADSHADCEECLGDTAAVSYPNGDCNASVTQAARSAGYRRGFHNSPGVWRVGTDPLRIPRVNIWDGTVVNERGEFSESHVDYALFWKPLLRSLSARTSTIPAENLP